MRLHIQDKTEWHEWFAWYPVWHSTSRCWVWLEKVDRMWNNTPFYKCWWYNLKKKEKG